MSRKRDRGAPRPRRSPTDTVANLTDDFMESLRIPRLPEGIPSRLEKAIQARVKSLLFHLEEARRVQYVGVLEVRLVRDAHRVVLTACELGLPDSTLHYARFRKLVEELGYARAKVGFAKPDLDLS